MLVRPLMTDFKMTVRADYAVSAWSPLPQPIKALAYWLLLRGVRLWTGVPHHFQGRLVPISLRPVLGIVAAYVMATGRSSCS